MDVPHQPSSVSQLLHDAQLGSAAARDRLFNRLLSELSSVASRLMAGERPGHSLTVDALLNEAMLRLLEDEVVENAPDRRYLFAAAIRAMSQILVEHSRHRKSLKRGGQFRRQPLDDVLDRFKERYSFDFEDLHAALDRLGSDAPRQREVVECRADDSGNGRSAGDLK